MKNLLLLFLMFATTFVATAQKSTQTPEARAQKKVDHLTAELNLSAEQQTKLYEVLLSQQQKRKVGGKNMRDLSQEERAALKTERKAAKAAINEQIAGILTLKQQETYQKLKKEHKQKAKMERKDAHHGHNHAKGEHGKHSHGKAMTPEAKAKKRTNRLTEQVKLNKQQQDLVYDLFLNQTPRTKGNAMKDLSKEERMELKEKRKAEKAAIEAKLAKILSPAQLTTYQNQKAEKKAKHQKQKTKIYKNR